MNYLKKNQELWNKGRYEAPNVENFIFRFYGRILKFDYGIDGSNGESVFDFGMGQGGNLYFFHKMGFNVFGADIAKNDVEFAKKTMPDKANQFKVISPQPDENLNIFPEFFKKDNEGFDIVISIQTLDFLSNTDFKKAIKCIYNHMKPGAKIYASMNGPNLFYFKHSTPVGDGLHHVKFENDRIKEDVYLNFVTDKEEMKNRFELFEPIYLDHYDSSFREEGSEFRYTFFGIKK